MTLTLRYSYATLCDSFHLSVRYSNRDACSRSVVVLLPICLSICARSSRHSLSRHCDNACVSLNLSGCQYAASLASWNHYNVYECKERDNILKHHIFWHRISRICVKDWLVRRTMPCTRCSAFTSLCIHVSMFLVISLCICIFMHKHSDIIQNNLLHEQTHTHAQLKQLRAFGRNDRRNRPRSGGISRQDDTNL